MMRKEGVEGVGKEGEGCVMFSARAIIGRR